MSAHEALALTARLAAREAAIRRRLASADPTRCRECHVHLTPRDITLGRCDDCAGRYA